MLMTMTHHDGGMRVMTAVKRCSVEEGPKGRHSPELHQDTSHSVAMWRRVVPILSIWKLRQWDFPTRCYLST